ncbi:MAG: ArsR family transcriptional regulator [Bacteroidota bacterium]|nr:ArsR family transcriptional regulator [Bacteroidota bacterium]
MKFFINSETTAYLRNLADEFGESTNSIRQELNRLEDAKLLESHIIQNKKMYRANTRHPYFEEIHKLLFKDVGIDQVIDNLVKCVGNLEKAYITDGFAEGNPGNTIDLVLVGNDFDDIYLHQLVRKTEVNFSLKIRYITVKPTELSRFIHDKSKSLLIWSVE